MKMSFFLAWKLLYISEHEFVSKWIQENTPCLLSPSFIFINHCSNQISLILCILSETSLLWKLNTWKGPCCGHLHFYAFPISKILPRQTRKGGRRLTAYSVPKTYCSSTKVYRMKCTKRFARSWLQNMTQYWHRQNMYLICQYHGQQGSSNHFKYLEKIDDFLDVPFSCRTQSVLQVHER